LKENFDRFTHDNFKEKEMADFRKMLFVLAGLMILIGTASAQTGVSCTAFVANQPILRQEGVTEPAGDILLNCVGVPTQAQTQAQTLSLYVNGAAITSRQLYSGSTVPNSIPTEAALLVNDNAATATQGYLQNGALVFSGFTLPTTGSFTVRVTNVRVNANSVAAGTFITGTILATFPIQNQSSLVLGVAQASLSVAVSSTSNFAQCTSTPTAGSSINVLTVKELVQSAFKSPAVCLVATGNGTPCPAANTTPGQWYQPGVNTESQTVLNGVSLGGVLGNAPSPGVFVDQVGAIPGQADSATRIRLNFSNIPAGVTISLPVSVGVGSNGTTYVSGGTAVPSNVTLVSQIVATTAGDVATFSAASGNSVSLTSAGSVTYQVTLQQGAAIDSFAIPVTVTYTYTPPSTPNTGSILVSATYAPTSAEISTSSFNQVPGIPRFADTSVLTPIITISACQTDLLFTFLTNQAGFDTGIAIANTSTDPFNTSAQNGTCTLNWYGNGPAAGTATATPSIASGSVYANLVSTLAAGLQGYMIAVCNFQYGHGFAFISDGYGQPGRGLSQGYLASVIPTPGLTSSSVCGTTGVRCAADASKASSGQGESLNQ
jgi:hypothetical protein